MGGTIYDDTGDLLRTFLSIPIPESFIASRYTPRHWTGIIYWQEVWKSPACLWSANDSVQLTEIRDRGLRRNDSIRSGWAGGDRRLKANDVELVSDIITKERRSRPLPNAARIPSPLLSLIARDVEIHLINDPPSSPLPSDLGNYVSRTCFTLFENAFSPLSVYAVPPPLLLRPYLLSRRTPYPLMASCHTCLPIRNICPRLC